MYLKEQTDNIGWNKKIVEYVLNHEKEIIRIIKGVALKSPQVLHNDYIEEVLAELRLKLYTVADYDEKIAAERSVGTKIITLESYVGQIAKMITKAYISRKYSDFQNIVYKEIKVGEYEEPLSLLDSVPDNKAQEDFEVRTCTLNAQLKLSEPYRYAYGIDLFLFFYIKLHYLEANQTQWLLKTLDISPARVSAFYDNIKNNIHFKFLIEELANARESALKYLGDYIYDKAGIDHLIRLVRYS